MGVFFSKLWNTLFETKPISILMVGLDAAGKTTILFKLKLGEVISTIPTIGKRLPGSCIARCIVVKRF